jgi:hypothetical protein
MILRFSYTAVLNRCTAAANSIFLPCHAGKLPDTLPRLFVLRRKAAPNDAWTTVEAEGVRQEACDSVHRRFQGSHQSSSNLMARHR